MIKSNKKVWWALLGVLITFGTLTAILVPVLNKSDNDKKKNATVSLIQKVISAKTQTETINALQILYELKTKTTAQIDSLSEGDLKIKYKSTVKLGEIIFANKKTNKIINKTSKEKTTGLKEILLIMTLKNNDRSLSPNTEWPGNQIDQTNDQFVILITFYKNQVVKVINKLQTSNMRNSKMIFFILKPYDLIWIFHKFKNAKPQTKDFNYYNAYLDDEHSSRGHMIFKQYLLSLKLDGSQIQSADLEKAIFIKGAHNPSTNTISVTLSFTYQGLSTSKVINNFEYKKAYQLSIKQKSLNKMADEVIEDDINITSLPSEITISKIESSTQKPDGTTIKITFNGGDVLSQELTGLVSYKAKAQALFMATINRDFVISFKANLLPSEYNDEQSLLNNLKKKTAGINDSAKAKIEKFLEVATITFVPDDNTGILQFTHNNW